MVNGVHDMGGMHGFGPVVREENEPRFHAEWEAHVAAMNSLLMRRVGAYNIDEFRHGIERMDPADYLGSSYYKRWLATVERNLTEKGYISADELDTRTESLRREPNAEPSRPAHATPPPSTAPPVEAPGAAGSPRFAVGDTVMTRNTHPTTHTRLPRYARGKHGVIHLVHGVEIFPDSHAHGRGEDPQPLYNVRFDAQELWGGSAEPNQAVYLDLWEPYLTPVED